MSDELENKQAAVEESDNTPQPGAPGESASTTPKKKGKGKIVLLVVVIAVVLLFGGVGTVYATQHSNPDFCNVICHTPMDPYVASFHDNASVNAQQASLSGPLGVTVHKESSQGIVCVTCHNDGIDAQIQEGMAWVSGNYTLPLEGFKLTAKQPKEGEVSGVEFCLRPGCHEGIESLEDLKKVYAKETRNPHESHNGDIPCSNCHQMHEQSVSWCTQCHADSNVPDGWLTYTEQQKQIKEAKSS